MNYLQYETNLEAHAESFEHRQHIVEFCILVKLMIEQLVPPIVDQQIEQYFESHGGDKMKDTLKT